MYNSILWIPFRHIKTSLPHRIAWHETDDGTSCSVWAHEWALNTRSVLMCKRFWRLKVILAREIINLPLNTAARKHATAHSPCRIEKYKVWLIGLIKCNVSKTALPPCMICNRPCIMYLRLIYDLPFWLSLWMFLTQTHLHLFQGQIVNSREEQKELSVWYTVKGWGVVLSEMFSLVSNNNVRQTVQNNLPSVFLPGNRERKYGAASGDVKHERASFQRLYLQRGVSEVQLHREHNILQRQRTILREHQGVWWKKTYLMGWKQHVCPPVSKD